MNRIIISMMVLLIAACATPAPAPDPGFVVFDYDRDGQIQLALDVDWSTYTKVHLETATVEFREHWVRDQKRHYDNVIREKDEERIKTGASDLLAKVLTRELSEEGAYEIVDSSGTSVMRWTPHVVELDVIAPDRVQDSFTTFLVDSQGSFTIQLEIHDSVSGKLLATTWQHQSDPYKGYLERTDSVTNTVAFRLMMERWADWLLENLASVRGNATE